MTLDPHVGLIMGSDSDWPVMQKAVEIFDRFAIPYEARVISAHRTPQLMQTYAQDAYGRGLKVIIAGAGGSAHLPGMVAASTILPVIGVPVKSSNSIDGWDSVLSILQMPTGVPVATVALNGAANAALLAVQILATSNYDLAQQLQAYKQELQEKVAKMRLPTTTKP